LAHTRIALRFSFDDFKQISASAGSIVMPGNKKKIVLKGNIRGKNGNVVISSRGSRKLTINLNGVKNNAPKDNQNLFITNDMTGGFIFKCF